MSDEKKSNNPEEVKNEEESPKTPEVEATPDAQPTPDASTDAPAEQSDEEKKIAEEEALAKQQAEEEKLKAEEIAIPDLRAGMTVRIHQKIQEGEKERIQVFQGIIIAMRGKTPETKTITAQKNSFGVLVEKIFPLASPLIEKIEVVKIAKVRRSKLYFLRDYSKKLKETLVNKS